MSDDASDLARQIDYYRARLDETAGQVIKADSVVSRTKRELKQRRAAFALLSELQRKVSADMSAGEIFSAVLPEAQRALKMDRIVLLQRTAGQFTPAFEGGFEPAASPQPIPVDQSLLTPPAHLLVTAASEPDEPTVNLRQRLAIPYFIAVPIVVGDETAGLLVCGRTRETKPFFPPLDEGDVYTLQSLAGFLGAALYNSALFARVQKMAASFARFVPSEFLKFLNRPSIVDVQLGDQTAAEMTILFSDIRSFTSLSEKMTAKQTFDFINAYLRHAAPVIQAHGGFIDKYIGDAIMALFPGDPTHAVRAAVELQRAAAAFSTSLSNDTSLDPRIPRSIAIGVGLHTGPLMLGTIGFENRMESTVISDTVNLASRMEGLTKMYGVAVLITGQTRSLMNDPTLPYRVIDIVQVKGKKEPVEVIEVFDADPPPQRALKQQTAQQFQSAFQHYRTGAFPQAIDSFNTILIANPQDHPARLLLERSREYQPKPPPNWTGVTALDHK